MKPRILLIGRNGQVGTQLASRLTSLGELVALNRQQLDLTKPNNIRRTIQEIRPQWIVNAAAYTAVDQAEKDEATAHAINEEAPAVIAEEAKKIGAALVHYSTDYVFDGSKKSPYEETDTPNPINVYGKTKLGGERAIQESGALHLIFRTEWVYATEGRNFLLTILRLATQKQELRIVADQIGSPTSSREIAAATVKVITQLLDREEGLRSLATVGGIYHMTAAGETSWHEFAKAILDDASSATQALPWFKSATNGMPLLTQRIIPITTAEYPTPASRPAYSVLSTARLRDRFGVTLPSWRAQLQSLFAAEAHLKPNPRSKVPRND
jgi:dTDP-4-dehydrorhamnose reductase